MRYGRVARNIGTSQVRAFRPFRLPDVCAGQSVFRQRNAIRAGRERGSMAEDDHPHWSQCGDKHCDRFPCVVYKEGYGDGWEDGHAQGYGDGYSDGYAEGFIAGAASASPSSGN